MRRSSRKGPAENGLSSKKILYICGSILAVAIIGFVITFLVYANKLEQETKIGKLNTSIVDNYSENTEETSSQFGKAVNEMSNEQAVDTVTNEISNEVNNESTTNTTKYAVNTSETEKKATSKKTNATTSKTTAEVDTKKTEDKQTEKSDEKKEEKVQDPEFTRPVEGEIIKEFAKDKLVYSNTLKEWVTHTGIDIKADKTTVVKASAEGTVKSIKNDPRYGLTIVIEHVNGFSTVYSNLLTAEFVVEGEKVKKGQTIGTVGNTATFEISDEPHLHFEIKKDGENLNPELYMKD